jgi:hypothetical protein
MNIYIKNRLFKCKFKASANNIIKKKKLRLKLFLNNITIHFIHTYLKFNTNEREKKKKRWAYTYLNTTGYYLYIYKEI